LVTVHTKNKHAKIIYEFKHVVDVNLANLAKIFKQIL